MAAPKKQYRLQPIKVQFDPQLLTWLRLEAARFDCSISEVLRRLVRGGDGAVWRRSAGGFSMKFHTMANQAHATAKAKGWHDTPRTWGELMALVHSELSEALEAYRETGDVMKAWTREDGKPEGVAPELADVLIRLGDASVWLESAEPTNHAEIDPFDIPPDSDPLAPFGDEIAALHVAVAHCTGRPMISRRSSLHYAAWLTRSAAIRLGLPIDETIAAKMAFNTTRPHRHGGKHL